MIKYLYKHRTIEDNKRWYFILVSSCSNCSKLSSERTNAKKGDIVEITCLHCNKIEVKRVENYCNGSFFI